MPADEPCAKRRTGARVLVLCAFGAGFMAIGSAACTIDTSKLRVATTSGRDAAADIGQARGDAHDFAVVTDAPAALPDVPGAADLLGREESDGDLAETSAEAGAVDSWLAVQDLPDRDQPDRDAPASVVDTSVTSDDAASSQDLPGEEAGSGGGRGTGGAGGATGAGGTGGATGTGGIGGTGETAAGGAGGATGSGGTLGTGGATQAGGAGGFTGSGGATVDPDLVLWYKFDESVGTVAADSSASGLDGKLAVSGSGGSATFSTDCRVGTHALRLTPGSIGSTQAGGYVTTPAPARLAPNAITIAFWVKLAEANSDQAWSRLFDFGTGTGATDPYLYMTPRSSDTSSPRFGITDVGRGVGSMQRLDAPDPLSANVWHHVAVVLPAGATYTGSLYIDGVVVVTNNAMTVHPADVGVTTDNWLGRSPSATDPFLSGWLDDFRIYKRALSADEINGLMALR